MIKFSVLKFMTKYYLYLLCNIYEVTWYYMLHSVN